MLTDTAVPAATSVPAEPSFFFGVLAGLEVGGILMYPVWYWLMKL